jgi:hypothetical protein
MLPMYLEACTCGVMGMLECLRAPSAPPGVREAGDALWLLPSCFLALSLSSSRRNCELFILREEDGRNGTCGKSPSASYLSVVRADFIVTTPHIYRENCAFDMMVQT